MDWFEPLLSIGDYPVSRIEFISVLAGIVAVYLAAREHILTWPIGLINISTAFFIYYSVHLYSDMFLQLYFFGIGIYGWWFWTKEQRTSIPLKWLSKTSRITLALLILICSVLLGYGVSQIHLFLPAVFEHEASYPYADTLVAVGSIVANTLLAKRYIENWILWIFIDLICVYLYLQKELFLIAMEFFLFLGLAFYGLHSWIKMYKHSPTIQSIENA